MLDSRFMNNTQTTPDLEYTQDGMFTRFYPNTSEGESAWRVMAAYRNRVGEDSPEHSQINA